MSLSIDQAFIKQFEREVHEAYQRQGSKLRNTVRTISNVNGSSTVFQRVGTGTASTKETHGLVPLMNLEHSNVEVILEDYYAGNNIIQVCQKPYQFSCWNRSDPNFKKLQAVTDKNLHFATCLRIARRAVIGALKEDVTKGATHYHADYVSPYWAKNEKPLTTIVDHIFYRLEEV